MYNNPNDIRIRHVMYIRGGDGIVVRPSHAYKRSSIYKV